MPSIAPFPLAPYAENVNRQFRIAAYDIREPRRLQQALHVLKGFSTGGQKSVFECFLTQADHAELLHLIDGVIDAEKDRFLTVEADPGPGVKTLGIALAPEDPPFFYVG